MKKKMFITFLIVTILSITSYFFFFYEEIEVETSDYGSIVVVDKADRPVSELGSIKPQTELPEEDSDLKKSLLKEFYKTGVNAPFYVPENQVEKPIYDMYGVEYHYKTLNDAGLNLPIPENFIVEKEGQYLYLRAPEDDEENLGIEISIKSKWINPHFENAKSIWQMFAYEIPLQLKYHNEDTYLPIPDDLTNISELKRDGKIVGYRTVARDAKFAMEDNPVHVKRGYLNWNFFITENRAIQLTVMGPGIKENRINVMADTLFDHLKRNRITKINIHELDQIDDNGYFSIPYSSNFSKNYTLYNVTSRFIINDDPLAPDYFMQYVGEIYPKNIQHWGEVATINDFYESDIFADFKNRFYITTIPYHQGQSPYTMHNYKKTDLLIDGRKATKNDFVMLYTSAGKDTQELQDGTRFSVFLIDYDKDHFIVVAFNYSEYQEDIANKYIANVISKIRLK